MKQAFYKINLVNVSLVNFNINLLFSDNITISVVAETINATLEDFSDSWKTKVKPIHRI